MSLTTNQAQLVAQTKDLMRNWDHARGLWRDQKCGEFERLFMQDIESGVTNAVNVIRDLEEIVQRVKRDCE